MADLSITAASVVKSGSPTLVSDKVAAATVTAGQVVYLNASSKFDLAKANGASPLNSIYGIALENAALNQPLVVLTAGLLTIGATVVVGTIYVLSGLTAGGIAPSTDLVSGWYTCILGVATTSGIITVAVNNSGVAVP